MKKFFSLLVFACFAGILFASGSSAHILDVNLAQTLWEVMVKLFSLVTVIGLMYCFIKLVRELLYLDVKGVRLGTPEETRGLERKYQEDLAKENGNGVSASKAVEHDYSAIHC